MAAGSDDVKTSTSPPSKHRAWKLPPFLNHFNAHDGKVIFRCWAAAWVALLLVFIQPVLENFGLATFFGALVLFIVPPASMLFAYLLASLSLLFGMCLAWAWGIATMKAALAARPDADTQRALRALGKAAAEQAQQNGNSVAWQEQILVHDGFMLDARVTAVFYVMGCVFIYLIARVRFHNHKFVPLQLFGTIVTDLFILIGPTLPSFTPNLGSVLIKPGAVGIGIGMACSLLFFPHSTSYAVLDKMEKVVLLCEQSLSATRRRLKDEPVSVGELVAAKGRHLGLYKAMEPLLAFLPLDMSRGRWDADDVRGLQPPAREAMMASLTLLDFHISRINITQREAELEKHHHGAEPNAAGIGVHQLQESADLIHALQTPENGEVRDKTREALLETTDELLQSCSTSIKLAAKCINTVNTRRWINQPKQSEFNDIAHQLDAHITSLRSTRETCIANTTERVLDSHADLFDEKGDLKPPSERGPRLLRGIIVSMVIEERIVGMALALEKLQAELLRLVKTRTTHRIWIPLRLRYAFSWIFDPRLSVSVSGTPNTADSDPDTAASSTDEALLLHDSAAKEAHQRLRVSRGDFLGPRRRSPLTRALAATSSWLTCPAGMYALRMVIVTIATSIPAAIPHSAGFFYREKGIWGVISAQTCLLVYMADFTFSVVCRGLGTVFGGVLGMVAWYIGSGSGPGNPYGLAAMSAVMILILMWLRVFMPPQYAQATIMGGATFVLVVGFSYDNHHIVQYGLPGIGYEAFWKRLVTVLLGFTASCIVQLFPKPPSATTHVCKTLSNTISTLADHYALILSHWGSKSTTTAPTPTTNTAPAAEAPPHAKPSPLSAVAEQISLDVAETLVSLDGPINLLKIEASFGPFDQHSLREIQKLCLAMNQSLGRLLALSSTLPRELQDRFTVTVGFLDDHVVGDVMAVLGVVGLSLKTGAAMPERLPAPLTRNFYTWWHAQHRNAMLSTELVRHDRYRRYCVAVSAYLRFLSAVDDLVLVVKSAVGECHVVRQWADA